MTLAITLNVVFMTLLVMLLAATMSLPFSLPSGERVQARKRRRRAERALRPQRAPYPAMREAQGSFAND